MTRILSKTMTAIAAASVLIATAAAADSGRRAKFEPAHQRLAKPAIGQVATKFKAVGQPDLVIEPRYNGNNGLPNTGYCGPWNGGNQKVYFYVKNIGNNIAPSSDVQVNFGGPYFAELTLPSLAPNQKTLRSYTIPTEAWDPGYHSSVEFLIAADHNDDMVEGSETNNYGQSSCIGPAG